MYDYNLLVSYAAPYMAARGEALRLLATLGDHSPRIGRTVARGILCVKTTLDSRQVIRSLHEIYNKDPLTFQFTLKWVPIDVWTSSELEAMRGEVAKLRGQILPGERWGMTVEKRRYTTHHRAEIIASLAELIDNKVDLKQPDKILRVEIIGRYAGVAVVTPKDLFSTTKPHPEETAEKPPLES